jgi:hypothetical protein
MGRLVRAAKYSFGGLLIATCVCNCAAVPDMAPDYMLPVKEIVLHAVCELRVGLKEVKKSYPSFHADEWAIGITVTPKVDTELSLRAGLTGKSTSVASPAFFNSWIVGSAPGAEFDSKGHKDASVKYLIHSKALLAESTNPLPCDTTSGNYHALVRTLGIQDWLMRSAAAAEGPIGKLTKADAPTFNAQVTVQWDGAGSFTYNFPFGTNFIGLYGSYKVDEAVALGFTPDPSPRKPLRTLPFGTDYASVKVQPPGTISASAQDRLDLLSLQQSIRNLETSTAPSRRR